MNELDKRALELFLALTDNEKVIFFEQLLSLPSVISALTSLHQEEEDAV